MIVIVGESSACDSRGHTDQPPRGCRPGAFRRRSACAYPRLGDPPAPYNTRIRWGAEAPSQHTETVSSPASSAAITPSQYGRSTAARRRDATPTRSIERAHAPRPAAPGRDRPAAELWCSRPRSPPSHQYGPASGEIIERNRIDVNAPRALNPGAESGCRRTGAAAPVASAERRARRSRQLPGPTSSRSAVFVDGTFAPGFKSHACVGHDADARISRCRGRIWCRTAAIEETNRRRDRRGPGAAGPVRELARVDRVGVASRRRAAVERPIATGYRC